MPHSVISRKLPADPRQGPSGSPILHWAAGYAVWTTIALTLSHASIDSFQRNPYTLSLGNPVLFWMGQCSFATFVIHTGIFAAWSREPVGLKIAFFLGGVLPVSVAYFVTQYLLAQSFVIPFLITTVPMMVCAIFFSLSIFRMATGAVIEFPSPPQRLVDDAHPRPEPLSIAHLLSATMVLAFCFAVLVSGDMEQNGLIWEWVYVTATIPVAAFLGGIACWILASRRPLLTTVLTWITGTVIGTFLCSHWLANRDSIMISVAAVSTTLLPFVIARRIGGKLVVPPTGQRRETSTTRPTIHKLD